MLTKAQAVEQVRQEHGRWASDELLHARVHLGRETVVIDVRGELCLASSRILLERLEELDGGFARLILDLRRVTFIDSTGIRLLVQMQSRAQRDGFDFAISLEGTLARTLRLVGLQDQFNRVAGEEIEGLLAEGSGGQD
jgi:anti-sigma B factor antagonist